MATTETPPAPRPDRPAVVGVCGGVGSGKSVVATALAARGAVVVDADRTAHEALDRPEVRDALVQEFGTGILGPDARIERALLRPLVFGPSPEHHARRRRLETHVHPVVRRMMQEAVDAAARRTPPPPFILLDVPLLTEGPTASWCDAIVYVDAPAAVRRARTARARGWSAEEHDRRESAQDPVEVKRRAARFVFDNGGDDAPSPAAFDALFASLAAVRPGSRA